MADNDAAIEEFRKFCAEEDQWKLAKEANGVKVHTRSVEGSSVNISRGIVTVKAPVEKCFEFAMDASRRTSWDKVVKESHKIRDGENGHQIVYMQSTAKWPASARDFVIDLTVKRLDDKTIIVWGKSPDTEEEPVPKGIVRGKCISSGYIFAPNADDTETTITYTMQLDMCGSVPNFLVNMYMVDEPLCLANFRDIVEKENK